MKSKTDSLKRFLDIILTLIAVSKQWEHIRDDIASLIENYIDQIPEESLERILMLGEWIDRLSKIFNSKYDT